MLDYLGWNQLTIAEKLIPEDTYKLTPELKELDKFLLEESFESLMVERFIINKQLSSVPVCVYIRMMFLKHYIGLSYEDLTSEVTHNLMYRFFCHIPLEQKVPEPTTLMRITAKFGEEIFEEINRRFIKTLLQKNSR